MTTEQLTAKTMEQAEDIAKNKADICELFNRVESLECASKEHGRIVESIHELALTMRDVKGEVKEVKTKVVDVDERVEEIEKDKKDNAKTVVKTVLTIIASVAATLLATWLMGH